MADFLTHLFLPLTAAYVLRPDLFPSPVYLMLGGFGLLSDFDKYLGMPGLLHSFVALGPLCLGVLVLEKWWRGEWRYGPLIVALIMSHLVVDFIDGGPVPLFFPFIETGIGLQYPAGIVFGEGLLGVTLEGPLVTARVKPPQPGFNTYGFIQGGGVASTLLFMVVYIGREWQTSPES